MSRRKSEITALADLAALSTRPEMLRTAATRTRRLAWLIGLGKLVI